MSEHEANFFKLLTVLATMTPNFELDEAMLEVYDKALSHYGYERLAQVIADIIHERGDRDPFPSIRTIKEKIDPQLSDISKATEAATRIIAGVKKFGYPNEVSARDYVGELGWKVVEMSGGWVHVCRNMMVDKETIFKAQFERLAKSLLEKHKLGIDLDRAPEIDAKESKLLENLYQKAIDAGKKGE